MRWKHCVFAMMFFFLFSVLPPLVLAAAEEKTGQADLNKKMDMLLAKQDELLDAIVTVKQELEKVKFRLR